MKEEVYDLLITNLVNDITNLISKLEDDNYWFHHEMLQCHWESELEVYWGYSGAEDMWNTVYDNLIGDSKCYTQ